MNSLKESESTIIFLPLMHTSHKEEKEVLMGEAIVPSAILMCLGVSTPIVTSDTEFVWFFDKEVMKYSSKDELHKLLTQVFKGDEIVKETLRAAEKYAIKHSPKQIVGESMKLFDELLRGKVA